jgi:osmotically-inducible protein OsmY
MYLLDPRQGNRRRSVARDKVRSFASRSSANAGKTYRHVRNKLKGVLANVTHNLRPEGSISDRKLCDRIRSAVGRTIPHPHQVDFAVHDGRVTLRGDLKPHEAGQVIQAIEKVAGVASIDNQIVDTSAVQ